ncbi:3-hydroxyisobutyrate dehydrogenase [Herbiconiux flava]|nr:3-hydroxyisobutyrate dehydrogenase [Herbiconiux flava]
MLANSRGPETLAEAVDSLGGSAEADTVEGAAARADLVLLAVPLHSYGSLPASALEGRIVMDAGNYYTDWSGHIQLPIAGDDEAAKKAVAELIESIGFDAVDAGALREGWRFQRGTPAYVVPLGTAELVDALQRARRYRDMAIDDLTTERTHRLPGSGAQRPD